SDFPVELHQDVSNRPHSMVGPFCRWADGWTLYAVRGVTVPAAWIERRDELDPSVALTDPNVERRRAAAEILGWDAIVRQLAPRVVDEDSDPEVGTLLRV